MPSPTGKNIERQERLIASQFKVLSTCPRKLSLYLHASVIHVESKIPVPDLKRGGFVVDQVRAYDIEFRYNAFSEVCQSR